EAADALARQLTSTWEQPTEPPVCLHGDVHLKNGLLAEDRVTLIDLDQAALGPAAADLGSLLAGLQYRGCVGVFSRSTVHALATAFLAGYAAVRPLPSPTSLRWHTAAALLEERAWRAVNRLRLRGLQYLDALLAHATALSTGDGS